MRKTTKKSAIRLVASTLILCMVLVLALAGCSKGDSKDASETPSASSSASPSKPAPSSESPKPIVELKAFFPGDTPKQWDEVQNAINGKLKADNVGVSLNAQFIGWDDYGNSTSLKLTAGEEFDLYLDAPWLHMAQMISSQAIIPLDDYLKDAPNLTASIPKAQWENNKFNGKVYGVPNGVVQGLVYGVMIRGDLREKYGLPPVKTIADFEKFLYEVKKNDPDIIPFGADGRNSGFLGNFFNPINGDGQYHGFQTNIPFVNIDENNKAVPVWETAGWEGMMNKATQLYKDGIIEKNVLQQANIVQLFNDGKVAAVFYSADGIEGLKYQDALKKGYKEEIFIPNDGKGLISDFKQWNFNSIPATSKHPDMVVKFLDWVSIKENHDLVEYGVVGKHWNPIGNDSYSVVEGSQYSFPAYVLTWRPGMLRTVDTMAADDKKWFAFARDAANFRKSETSGFTVNSDPIKTEVAKLTPLQDSLYKPLNIGALTADKGIPKLKDAVNKAGLQKVVEEVQKQFDTFKAGQGK